MKKVCHCCSYRGKIEEMEHVENGLYQCRNVQECLERTQPEILHYGSYGKFEREMSEVDYDEAYWDDEQNAGYIVLKGEC